MSIERAVTLAAIENTTLHVLAVKGRMVEMYDMLNHICAYQQGW